MLRLFTLARKSASKEAGAVNRKGFDRISFLTTIQHRTEYISIMNTISPWTPYSRSLKLLLAWVFSLSPDESGLVENQFSFPVEAWLGFKLPLPLSSLPNVDFIA
jgi:hypothetical protein